MTKKPISNIGASVQQRLLNLRDKTGEDFNALLTQFAIERFLYRLSQSSLADRVVLKGAMLFRVWSGSLHRPTKDVDLLGYGEATTAAVAAMIRQIITAAVEDDGFGSDPAANRLWREFLARMQLANEPTDFAVVIRTIRERLWPTIEAAGKQAIAPMRGSSM